MIRQVYWQALRAAVDALLPPRCAFCGVETYYPEQRICSGCHDDLPWIRASCPTCALELPRTLPAGVRCARCQLKPPPFVAAIAPLEYSFPVDAAIKALKFQRRHHFASALAEPLLEVWDRVPTDVDAILPVPLHRWRQLGRGFNQSLEIARPVAKKTGLPLLHSVRRVVATPYQSGLSAGERGRNLRGAFRIDGALSARHVLIVDDVVTTGETCRQLAGTLRAGGVDMVSVLAVARA